MATGNKNSGNSKGKPATSRRKASRAKPKAAPEPEAPQAAQPTAADVEGEIALEPGVTLPAPKPPSTAREAREMAKGEQQAADDGAPEQVPSASEAAAPAPLTLVRDGQQITVEADEEPPEGYARGRVVYGTHLYFVQRNGHRRHYTALKDDLLELPAAEIQRGVELGALVDPDYVSAIDAATDPLDLDTDQLGQWVGSHTVDEVIVWATSVERANRLLEAERASHSDPRVGVLRGIEAMLSSPAITEA